jgi:hypothetical protein
MKVMTDYEFYRDIVFDWKCREDHKRDHFFPALYRKAAEALKRFDGVTPRDESEIVRVGKLIEKLKAGLLPPEGAKNLAKANNPYKKKNVNARMLEKMQQDSKSGNRECHGWTCKQWALFLRCSTASVVGAPVWMELKPHRENLKAEKARDRHGRKVGRRKGDYGQS